MPIDDQRLTNKKRVTSTESYFMGHRIEVTDKRLTIYVERLFAKYASC